MDEIIVSYDSDNNEIISYNNVVYACEENINDIAYDGKCFIYSKGVDGNNGYCSNVLNKPTFKDLLKIADAMIECTKDYDHCFFEGVEIKGLTAGEIMEIDLFLGS